MKATAKERNGKQKTKSATWLFTYSGNSDLYYTLAGIAYLFIIYFLGLEERERREETKRAEKRAGEKKNKRMKRVVSQSTKQEREKQNKRVIH